MPVWAERKFLFIGGLHRSGTTIFHDLVAEHPAAAGLTGTGVPMNEGQFLQDVFAPEGRYRKLWPIRYMHRLGLRALAEKGYGGPGRFAFDSGANLKEDSPLTTAENAERIGESWAPYWSDPHAECLAEKSPPNLIRFRFLQALFPNSRFVLVMRHPIPVSLSTQRHWRRRTTMYSLFRHWVYAHELFLKDEPHLRHLLAVRYEDLMADPRRVLAEVFSFLSLPYFDTSANRRFDPTVNDRYLKKWRRIGCTRAGRAYQRFLTRTFETSFSKFGYTIEL